MPFTQARDAAPPAPAFDPVIALVDDDPLYVDYLTGLLAVEGLRRVRGVDARRPVFPALNAIEADCLVIDYDLGHDNGFNVAQRVLAERSDAPALVMMTGTGSERTVIKAMRLGFHDYVSKRTLTGAEMVRAIGRAIEARRPADVIGTKDDAVHAPTGLPARVRMEAALANLCAARSRRPFAFGLVEPDLAEVTARLGIGAAERARVGFVYALRKSCAATGVLGHWAGDRFAWATHEGADPTAFAATMTALPAALERTVTVDGAWARVSARAGAVLMPPGRHEPHAVAADAGALLDAATEAGEVQRHAVRGHHTADSAPHASPAGNERRASRRRRCLKLARIVLPGDRAVVDCTVANISERGACLKAKSFFVAPDTFAVEIVGSGERRPARVAWQKGPVMGVEFTDAMLVGKGTVH